MDCTDARRHWNLYYDSEGDAELYFQINEHLAVCPDCAEWFHAQSRLEDRIAGTLAAAGSAGRSPELWSSVLAHSGLEKPAAVRRWFFFGSLVALAASLLIGIGLWQLVDNSPDGHAQAPPVTDSDLVRLTADYHERFVDGRKEVQFVSHSDLDVESYLRRQVKFPVRCPPRQDTGFLVRGAGVCRNPGCEVVYLVGHVDDRPVSIFILSKKDLERFRPQLEALRRERVHQRREGARATVMAEMDQNVVLVVGETDADPLMRILKAYGSYHEGHRG